MIKNILITGGAGFIGSNLALKLINLGYNITILDNLSVQIHGENPRESSFLYNQIKGKTKFIEGSVTDPLIWGSALNEQHAIIHLAAETGTGQSMYDIQRYTDVNIVGTSLMLNYLANNKHTVKKIVVASSRAIYGEGKYWSNSSNSFCYPDHRAVSDLEKGKFDFFEDAVNQKLVPLATDENSLIHPSSVYGITKDTQERLIMTVSPLLNIKPVAFRFQNVYGPGQSLKNPYTGILSIFSTLINIGSPINIFEDGQETRDFVYINDVVDATILGLEKEEANGEVFNVGTGIPTTVLNVAEILIEKYSKKVEINISGNFRNGDIRHNFADMNKIKNILGFKSKVSLDEGLNLFCSWVKIQDPKYIEYSNSISEMKKRGLFK